MTTLHLGVLDVPYNAPRGKRQKRSSANTTTGDVAEILEARYHIMEVFYEAHKADIAAAMESSAAGALENLLLGAPSNVSPFGSASGQVEMLFKKFLESREMETLGVPGVPTQAALEGRSSRFKKGKNKAGRRPSFIDTGLYESTFKAWFD